MGAYDKKEFSKQYSLRTETNLKYIKKTVNRDKLIIEAKEKILDEYNSVIRMIDDIIVEIRKDAKDIVNVQKKGKNVLSGRLYDVARKLDMAKKKFEKELNKITSLENIEGEKLYEVT